MAERQDGRWIWAGATAAVIGLWAASPAVVVLAPVLGLAAWSRSRRRATSHERERTEAAFLGWIDAVARDLGTGSALGPALRARLPEFEALATLGAPRTGREVLAALRAADGSSRTDAGPPIELLTMCLGVLVEHGGPAALGLERLAETLRSRAAGRALRRAHAAQARASAVVVAVVPAGFGGLAAAIEPQLATFYLRSLPGAICLGAAAASSLGGFAWMEREIDRVAR